jgi:hypothetical protein
VLDLRQDGHLAGKRSEEKTATNAPKFTDQF